MHTQSGFEERIRASFAKQGAMGLIGARLTRIVAGEVEIELPFKPEHSQQHGFLHAGILSTALDSACGYATYSLFPPEAGILTIEFKVNLLAPGDGELFRMIGRVRKAGRTISLAEGEAYAIKSGREKLIATMTATTMTIAGRDNVIG
jgi:uncharacterized protein (TIGR00369 family)